MKWSIAHPYETATIIQVFDALKTLKKHKQENQKAWVSICNSELETMRLGIMRKALSQIQRLIQAHDEANSRLFLWPKSADDEFNSLYLTILQSNFDKTIDYYRENLQLKTPQLKNQQISTQTVCQMSNLSAGCFGMLQKMLLEIKPEISQVFKVYLANFALTESLYLDNLNKETQQIISKKQFVNQVTWAKRAAG